MAVQFIVGALLVVFSVVELARGRRSFEASIRRDEWFRARGAIGPRIRSYRLYRLALWFGLVFALFMMFGSGVCVPRSGR